MTPAAKRLLVAVAVAAFVAHADAGRTEQGCSCTDTCSTSLFDSTPWCHTANECGSYSWIHGYTDHCTDDTNDIDGYDGNDNDPGNYWNGQTDGNAECGSMIQSTSRAKVCGNYCGPGWCGARCQSEAACINGMTPSPDATPANCPDSCCRDHDKCCAIQGDGYDCNSELDSCIKRCGGRNMGDCDGLTGWLMDWYMHSHPGFCGEAHIDWSRAGK